MIVIRVTFATVIHSRSVVVAGGTSVAVQNGYRSLMTATTLRTPTHSKGADDTNKETLHAWHECRY